MKRLRASAAATEASPKAVQPPLPCVGVIGLGTMGSLMARSLVQAGHRVVGCDPLAAARQRLRREGGVALPSAAHVAQAAEVVITALPSSAALQGVVAGLPPADRTRPARLFIETSTLPVADKQAVAAALRRLRWQMVDAPISGTATPVPQQVWIMYLSGPVAACRQAAAVVRAFTLSAPRVGPLGDGMKLKIAANHLVALHNVANAEMVTLCRAMGLDPHVALQHMGHSPYLGTGLMRLRVPMMIARQYEPATMALALWQKDMQVIGDMASAVRCPTPLLDACRPIYTAALAQGLGAGDTAAVAEVLARLAGNAGSA